MGTRSTIAFYSEYKGEETHLVTVYQQYDGYIEGVGHTLAKWLLSKKMINGIGGDQHTDEFANGAGCLVAQFIRDMKHGVGNLYIVEEDTSKDLCDYNYKVVIDDDYNLPSRGVPLDYLTMISVTRWNNQKPFFIGRPSILLEYKENE